MDDIHETIGGGYRIANIWHDEAGNAVGEDPNYDTSGTPISQPVSYASEGQQQDRQLKM